MLRTLRKPALPVRVSAELPWSWIDTLATARPGFRYRIIGLPFSTVQERCGQLSCREGEELLCVESRNKSLLLERPDGQRIRLEKAYAWFIQVQPMDLTDHDARPIC